MNPGMLIGIAVIAYLFLREHAGGTGGLFGSGGATTPVPAPAPVPTGPSANPTAIALNQLQSDPIALAQALLHVTAAGGFPGNPTLSYDQWNWFATERLSPLMTPPDFSSVAPRDAGGSTPSVTALEYAQHYVTLKAKPASAGVSGLAGLMGNVVDLHRAHTPNKWTM